MTATTLLQWHYLIFLLPLGASLMLLLLTSLRGGGRHGGGHHRGVHTGHHGGHAGHAARGNHGHSHAKTVGGKTASNGAKNAAQNSNIDIAGALLAVIGIGRVPMLIAIQMFCLFWGVLGILANQALLPPDKEPTVAQVIPSMFIALVGGLIGARLSGEVFVRLTPKMETSVVSRDGLYGLTGRVAFPVTETGGRILIYDENQTMHDERCRVAAGHAAIAKGRSAMVIDRDADGALIVEEVVA